MKFARALLALVLATSIHAQAADVVDIHFVWHDVTNDEVVLECTSDWSMKERLQVQVGLSKIAKHIYGCTKVIEGVNHIYTTKLVEATMKMMEWRKRAPRRNRALAMALAA